MKHTTEQQNKEASGLSASHDGGDLKLIAFAIENTWLNGLSHGWGNGYVAIPKGHPCYGMDYNEIHNRYEIDINGGLTYSDKANKTHPKKVRESDMWVVGFDTCHSWDTMAMWPDEKRVMNEANNLKRQLETLTFTQDWKEKSDNENKLATYEQLKAENTKLAASNLELVEALTKIKDMSATLQKGVNAAGDNQISGLWEIAFNTLKKFNQ